MCIFAENNTPATHAGRKAKSVLISSQDWLSSFSAAASSQSPSTSEASENARPNGATPDAPVSTLARRAARSSLIPSRPQQPQDQVSATASAVTGNTVTLEYRDRQELLEDSATSPFPLGPDANGPGELWERIQQLQEELVFAQAALAAKRSRGGSTSPSSGVPTKTYPVELTRQLQQASGEVEALREALGAERRETLRLSHALSAVSSGVLEPALISDAIQGCKSEPVYVGRAIERLESGFGGESRSMLSVKRVSSGSERGLEVMAMQMEWEAKLSMGNKMTVTELEEKHACVLAACRLNEKLVQSAEDACARAKLVGSVSMPHGRDSTDTEARLRQAVAVAVADADEAENRLLRELAALDKARLDIVDLEGKLKDMVEAHDVALCEAAALRAALCEAGEARDDALAEVADLETEVRPKQ